MRKLKVATIIIILLFLLTGCFFFNSKKPPTYTIYFESNGGNAIESIKSNEEIPKPTREGYAFLGWYLDNEPFEIPFDKKTFNDKDDVTLYAKWKYSELEALWRDKESLFDEIWGDILDVVKKEFEDKGIIDVYKSLFDTAKADLYLKDDSIWGIRSLVFLENPIAIEFENEEDILKFYSNNLFLSAVELFDISYNKLDNQNIIACNFLSFDKILTDNIITENNVYYSKDKSMLIRSKSNQKDITIPEEVKEIGFLSFFSSEIESVHMTANVENIRLGAFANSTHLAQVTFSENTKIKSIYDYTFSYCESLIDFEIPEGVEKIGYTAFEGCENLKTISLPQSVAEISGSFDECINLISIEVNENNPTFISLNGDLYSRDMTRLIIYAPGKKDKEFIIPETVNVIEATAFRSNNNLNSITIPKNVYTIDLDYDNWPPIEEINVDENNNNFKSIDGNLYNKSGSILIRYSIAKKQEAFVLPAGVYELGIRAFKNTENLKYLLVSNNVTLGNSSFDHAKNLTVYFKAQSEDVNWSKSKPAIFDCVLSPDKSYVVSILKTSGTSENAGNPYRQGYIFDGWYTSDDFSGDRYETIASAPQGRLYASWSEVYA